MSRTRIRWSLALAAAGLFSVGFLLGDLNGRTARKGNDDSAGERVTESRLTALGQASERKGGGRTFVNSLRDLEHETDGLMVEMREFISGLEALEGEEFFAALDELLDLYEDREYARGSEELNRKISMAMFEWAKSDGPAAMDFLKARRPFDNTEERAFVSNSGDLLHGGDSLYYTALCAWAHTDPDAAEEWALTAHAEQAPLIGGNLEQNSFLRPVVHALALTDPARASALANEIGYGGNGIESGEVFEVLLDAHVKQGWEATRDWFLSARTVSEDFYKRNVGEVARRMAMTDLAGAEAFAETVEDNEMRKAVYEAVLDVHWASDPQQAVRWARQLADEEQQAHANRLIERKARQAESFGR